MRKPGSKQGMSLRTRVKFKYARLDGGGNYERPAEGHHVVAGDGGGNVLRDEGEKGGDGMGLVSVVAVE